MFCWRQKGDAAAINPPSGKLLLQVLAVASGLQGPVT
jgi:hypothetical protein